jgi:putative resolvase
MGSIKEEGINLDEVCIYGRVSSHEQKQKGDLDRQCQRLSDYCAKKKYKVSYILKDVGSGLSDTRKSLLKLFNLVVDKKISKVIIEHKDRLTRFQFKVFEYFFNSYIESLRKPHCLRWG